MKFLKRIGFAAPLFLSSCLSSVHYEVCESNTIKEYRSDGIVMEYVKLSCMSDGVGYETYMRFINDALLPPIITVIRSETGARLEFDTNYDGKPEKVEELRSDEEIEI